DYEEDVTGACRPLLRALEVWPASRAAVELVEELEPQFSQAEREYTIQTSFWATEVAVAPSGAAGSSVTVDGTPIEDGEEAVVPLELGSNTVEIVVSDGAAATDYRLVVHRREPIRIPYPVTGARFGNAVVASGDFLVVGAPGATRLVAFERTGPGIWEDIGEIAGGPGFGTSLAYDGTTLAVGAPNEPMGADDYIGALHLFRQTGSGFEEEQRSVMSVLTAAHALG